MAALIVFSGNKMHAAQTSSSYPLCGTLLPSCALCSGEHFRERRDHGGRGRPGAQSDAHSQRHTYSTSVRSMDLEKRTHTENKRQQAFARAHQSGWIPKFSTIRYVHYDEYIVYCTWGMCDKYKVQLHWQANCIKEQRMKSGNNI